VRPLYWEDPLPEAPDLGLPSAELRSVHFTRVPWGADWPQDAYRAGSYEHAAPPRPYGRPEPSPAGSAGPAESPASPAERAPWPAERGDAWAPASATPKRLSVVVLVVLVVVLLVILWAVWGR
jgi:hypothetical protein